MRRLPEAAVIAAYKETGGSPYIRRILAAGQPAIEAALLENVLSAIEPLIDYDDFPSISMALEEIERNG